MANEVYLRSGTKLHIFRMIRLHSVSVHNFQIKSSNLRDASINAHWSILPFSIWRNKICKSINTESSNADSFKGDPFCGMDSTCKSKPSKDDNKESILVSFEVWVAMESSL